MHRHNRHTLTDTHTIHTDTHTDTHTQIYRRTHRLAHVHRHVTHEAHTVVHVEKTVVLSDNDGTHIFSH